MSWAPSSHLRDEVSTLLAVAMPDVSPGEPHSSYKAGQQDATRHAVMRCLKWEHGIDFCAGRNIEFWPEFIGFTEIIAENLHHTWDGQEYAWAEAVDSILAWFNTKLTGQCIDWREFSQ